MLSAAQQSEPGKTGYRLDRLRRYLDEGYPVGEAIELAVPEVSRRAIALASAGEQVGQLAPALRRAVSEQRTTEPTFDPTTTVFYRIYPVVLILFVAAILGMLSVFVMPKYQQIFRDFALPLPWVTTFTMQWSRALAPPIALIMAVVVLIITGRFLWETFRPFNIDLELGGLDYIRWAMPGVHGLVRDRGLADVCALLADATEAGMPVDRALMEASHLNINRVLRDRIDAWSKGVVEGQGLSESARRARLPRLLVGMLAPASRAPGGAAEPDEAAVSGVFRFLERYYRSRFSRSLYLLQGMLIPLVVLVMAVVVIFVALALLAPVVALTNALSSQGGVWRF
jgi:type II secretory pathway component PulF